MTTDVAEHRRDRRLRKRLLQALHAARVRPESGWASGRFLYDLVDGALPGGQQFDSDLHMLGLARDLVNARYAEERDDRGHRDDPFGLDALSYRVTAHGTALVLELIDPDPLVEDSRLRTR
jgi:hypothetical protein